MDSPSGDSPPVWRWPVIVLLAIATVAGVLWALPRLRHGRRRAWDRLLGAFEAGRANPADVLSFVDIADDEWISNTRAVYAVARLGRPAVAPLREEWAQGRSRAWILAVYAELGADAGPALPDVIEALRDGTCRAQAIHVLDSLGEAARPAKPELAAILADRSDPLRFEAGRALWQLDPASATVGAAVVDAHADAIDRGPFPHEAGSALNRLLDRAGRRLDASAAIPALVRVLGGKDTDLKARAWWALRKIAPRGSDALAALAVSEVEVLESGSAGYAETCACGLPADLVRIDDGARDRILARLRALESQGSSLAAHVLNHWKDR